MTKKIILSVLICLLVLGGVIGALQWTSSHADEKPIEAVSETVTEDAVNVVAPVEMEKTEWPVTADAGSLTIGNPDAPVTIYEFSSLSCPHCASFHTGALPDLKKDYVDSGKVKFVFGDFPLNAPAVAGALLLKCVPIEDRYDFKTMLFEQQVQWAIDANYAQKLQQYAALIGIGNEKSRECMTDSEAEVAMFEMMRESNAKHGIQSTPTFVIEPGGEKLTGALPYGEFSKRIEALLAAE